MTKSSQAARLLVVTLRSGQLEREARPPGTSFPAPANVQAHSHHRQADRRCQEALFSWPAVLLATPPPPPGRGTAPTQYCREGWELLALVLRLAHAPPHSKSRGRCSKKAAAKAKQGQASRAAAAAAGHPWGGGLAPPPPRLQGSQAQPLA